MARSAVLVPVIVVVSVFLRALPRPVCLGAPDEHADVALGLAAPFGDDLKGSSDAFLSSQARSLLREGWDATWGIPLLNASKSAPADFVWYGNHPPGVAQATALAFALFGESERVARGVALACSTLMLVALVLAVRNVAGDLPAIAAAVGVCATPLGWYWASHLDYQVPTLAFVTVFLIAALREPQRRRDRIVAALALIAALACDFLAVLAIAAVGLVRLASLPRRIGATIGLGALGGVTALGIVAYLHFGTARHGTVLGAGLAAWVQEVWTLEEGVGTGGFLAAVGRHLLERAGVLPLLGLAIGALLAATGRGKPELRRLFWAGVVFAALAGTLPRSRAFDHAYFQIPWVLPIGVAFALVLDVARARRPVPSARRDLVLGWDWKRAAPGLAIAALVMTEGWTRSIVVRPEEGAAPWFPFGSPRFQPPADRPSAARLGRELALRPAEVGAFALPPASPATTSFAEFVPDWYAGRRVERLGPDGTRAGIQPRLALLGLAQAEVELAKGDRWPGSEGYERLPPPPMPPPR